MTRRWLLLVLVLAPAGIQAGAGVMLGIGFNFNGDLGVTLKLLSSDRENEFVAAGGVTWFPRGANPLGVDVGLGYNFRNAGVAAGWDIVNSQLHVGAGYVDTSRKPSTPAGNVPPGLQ